MSDSKPSNLHKPNFFILGSAKSGTTSLHRYLRQHPDVFMSHIKEPTFFCQGFQVVKNPIRYFDLFASVKRERIIGESSHAYMTNPSTARVLKTLFPDARFVVILRNPADRAYSLYNHMRRYGHEKIGSFEKALEIEETRFHSKEFQRRCPQYIYNFLYFRSGLYGEQIERYFELFDRQQFHFLTLDLLKSQPMAALQEILTFLELDPDFTPNLRVHNEGSITARFPLVQYFWTHKVKHPRFLRKQGFKILEKVNFKRVPPIRPETRSNLLARYESDLRKLRDLTGIGF
jgi:hypothetical protein